jgi:glutamate transport system permease protein
MTDTLLERDFGPKARRNARIASVIAVVIIVAVVTVVILRFAALGELSYEKWALYFSIEGWVFLLGGLGNTLGVVLCTSVIALAAGATVTLGQLSRWSPVRRAAVAYAEIFRSLPTLLLILFCYFGLSSLGISAFWSIVLGSAAYNSAALSNIFRAGVLTLDGGQADAAAALGLSRRAAMRRVLAPQAVRRMMPSIVSQMIILLKDSSLGFFIGFEELLRRGQIAGSFTQDFLQSYFVVGCIYLVLCFSLSRVARALEKRGRLR